MAAGDKVTAMRLAAVAYHYVGAGSGAELLQNLAGLVVVPSAQDEESKEGNAAAAEGTTDTATKPALRTIVVGQ